MFINLFRREPKFQTWINQDGSTGGQVSRFATVDPKATIEKFSIVLSGSNLGPDAYVRAGDMIDGDMTIRFGPVLPQQPQREPRRAIQPQ